MPRPQFTLRALLVAMTVVGAFFGGVQFERQRRSREREAELVAMRLTIGYQIMPHKTAPGISKPSGKFMRRLFLAPK